LDSWIKNAEKMEAMVIPSYLSQGFFFIDYSIWEAQENSASHQEIEGLAYLEAKRMNSSVDSLQKAREIPAARSTALEVSP